MAMKHGEVLSGPPPITVIPSNTTERMQPQTKTELSRTVFKTEPELVFSVKNKGSRQGDVEYCYPSIRLICMEVLLAVSVLAALNLAGQMVSYTRNVELVPAQNKHHASGTGKVLWISDIHIDPYYGDLGTVRNCTRDTKYGGKGCDTPWRLFTSLVQSAQQSVPDPDFILTTGDYIRHWPELMPDPENAEYEVLVRIVSTLENTFPSAHKVHVPYIVNTLGNDDLYPPYTIKPVTGRFQSSRIAKAWKSELTHSEMKTFKKGGYYVREIPHKITGSKLRLVVLNTVMYSSKLRPRVQSMKDPYGQLEWMRIVLKDVRDSGGSAWIIGHIPPGKDTFARNPQWVDRYVHKYLQIVSEYRDIITAQLFGHTHSDEFRAFPERDYNTQPSAVSATNKHHMPKGPPKVPIIIGGAVSPLFGNNPSYRVVEYHRKTSELEDYQVYNINLNGNNTLTTTTPWALEYSARERFELKDLSNAEYVKFADKIRKGGKWWDKWKEIYFAGGTTAFACDDVQCKKEWGCVLETITDAHYRKCLREHVI